VLALNPAPPAEIHTKLADLYMREDAYGQAYAEMQAYLRADPNGRLAPKVRRIMQEMEASGVLRSVRARPLHTRRTALLADLLPGLSRQCGPAALDFLNRILAGASSKFPWD
jgi:hypothetical protein